MIRISTNEMDYRYLKYSSKESYYHFNRFAEKMGLDLKLYHDNNYDLLSNRIIVPSLSIRLPIAFYKNWTNYPLCPSEIIDKELDNKWGILYYLEWFSSKDEDEWYLHPYDRVAIGQKYCLENIKTSPKNGNPIIHSNGHKFTTTNTYVPYWQIYRIFDIIQDARRFIKVDMLLSSKTKMESATKNFGKQIRWYKEGLKQIQDKWERYSESMTNLSYFRTLRGICIDMELRKNGNYHELLKEGAFLLRDRYSITIESLEICLREIFLKEYNRWKLRKKYEFAEIAILMQKDIYCLTEWLCYLTGKRFDYYFDKYENKSRFSNGYANLLDVLPFEYEQVKRTMNELLWHYVEELNNICEGAIISKEDFKVFLEVMDKEYSSFYIFIRSVSKMQREWNKDAEITFDNSSMIDYLIILLGKSETLLKEVINQKDNHEITLGPLVKLYSNSLSRNFSFKMGLRYCVDNWKLYTKSWKEIDEINSAVDQSKLSSIDKWFAKNLFLYARSRNYFVHSYKYDNDEADIELIELATKSTILSVMILSYFCIKERRIAEQSLQPDKMP